MIILIKEATFRNSNYVVFFQRPEFLQKALNHAMCIGDQRLKHGKLDDLRM